MIINNFCICELLDSLVGHFPRETSADYHDLFEKLFNLLTAWTKYEIMLFEKC